MKRLFHLTNNWISSWKGKLTSSYMMRTIKSSLQSFSAAVIVACSISFSGWGGSFVQCKVIGNLEQDFVMVKCNCEYFTPLRSFWEFTLTLKYLLEILWCGTGICVFNFDLKVSVSSFACLSQYFLRSKNIDFKPTHHFRRNNNANWLRPLVSYGSVKIAFWYQERNEIQRRNDRGSDERLGLSNSRNSRLLFLHWDILYLHQRCIFVSAW